MNLILSLVFVLQVYANEGAEAPKSEGQGSAPAAGAEVTPDQIAAKELADVEKQVSSLAAKIKAKNDSIEHLLTQKSVESNAEKLTEIVKFIQQEHRELEKLTNEYNTQLGVLQYRFPEKGLMLSRRYQRLNTKSLVEMEKTLGLDSHLKKSRDKVKMVYGVSDRPPVKKPGKHKSDPTADEGLLQPSTLSK